MTRTKARLLTVAEQKVAASDAVLFGGPYNVLDSTEEVVRRYMPEKSLQWAQEEYKTALDAVCYRATKLAEQIVTKYGR